MEERVMLTLHDALLLGLLPLAVAVVAMALAWRRKRAGGGGWAMVLAIAVGVLAAGLAEFMPKGMPKEAMEWLVLLPAGALAVGLAAEFLPWWIAVLLVLGAGIGEAYLMAMTLAAGGVTAGVMVVLGAAPGILYALWRPLAVKRGGPNMLMVMLFVAGVTVIVESAGTAIQFGQYTMALAAALAGVLLGRLVFRRPNVSNGGVAAFVLVWMGLLIFGYLWADVPAWRTAVLAAAPLAAWGAEIPRGLKPFWRGVVRLGLVAVPLAVVGIPAAMELIRLIRSQSEVGGY
jgi:hypothetical protein